MLASLTKSMDSALSVESALTGRISTTIDVLSDIVRDSTERACVRLTRTIVVYAASVFTAGFALGITVGVLVQRLLRDRHDILEHQIESIRNEIAALRSDSQSRYGFRRPSPTPSEAYLGDEGEEEDEFFEVRSNGSSDSADFFSTGDSARGLYTSPSASSLSGRAFSRCLSSTPLPTEVALELDALAEAALHPLRQLSDENGEGNSVSSMGAASRAFARCLVYKKQYKRRPEYLWRLSRAAHLVAVERKQAATDATSPPSGFPFNISSSSSSSAISLQTASEFTHLGLCVARRAVQLSRLGMDQGCVDQKDAALSYKWLAIFVGLLAQSSGINQKIQLGYEFKKHIDNAIKLDPSEAYCHFLKGRWCFEVYNLSWVERQFASRLFATLPTATIEEAIDEFLEVERLKPNYWPSNQIYLAKCEFARSHYTEAKEWITRAGKILEDTDKPNGDDADRADLLAEVAVLQPKYASWVR
nr:unnamed protein product [Spirometra erinaceieuropaei]